MFPETIHKIITTTTGISPLTQKNIVMSVFILVIIWLIRFGAAKIIDRRIDSPQARYRWYKSILYVSVILSVLLVGRVWFAGFQSLITFLGLLSAGIAIALKDLISNMAGWLFIMIRRPFSLGDRIEIMDITGDVIDLRLFLFSVIEVGNWVNADQSTGRIIDIPNSKIFTESCANYTKGFRFIWDEMPVTITFESDWEKAKSILERISMEHTRDLAEWARQEIEEASRQYMVHYSTLTPVVYTSVADIGVTLTIRYLSGARKRRKSSQALWENILREFSLHKDIDFAYPTVRYYDNRTEGKPGKT